MSIATVCIALAPHHEHLVSHAIESVKAQTVPVELKVFMDFQMRGAGYARNQAAEFVDTPFVVFLDSDDTLNATFIERCLLAYDKGHYVYTGWNAGKRHHMPKANTPYEGEGYHLVTTLIPTVAFNVVGRFDETLPGYEDADLHFKLLAAGLCGTLVPEYLVNYSAHGTRSKAFEARADKDTIRREVYNRHGGRETIMCCGNEGLLAPANPGAKQEGDVLAIATWGGIQTVASVTGARVYRSGNGAQLWVAPEDIEAQPKMFRRTYSIQDLTPEREDVLKSSGLI